MVKTDVKQIDVHAERLDKCAIVDAIQILLVKINECIYHFFFVFSVLRDIDLIKALNFLAHFQGM